MAMIGHGLVGLAAAGLMPRRGPKMRFGFLVPGSMVLLAYAVDIVEWIGLTLQPDRVDTRFITHSPGAIATLTVAACICAGLFFRIRKLLAFVLVAGAVASHALLDAPLIRFCVAELYNGGQPADSPPDLLSRTLGEVCVYGLPLVLILLGRAATERGCPRRGRLASLVLAALAVGGAAARAPFLWCTAYVLSTLHAVILLRRHVQGKLVWNFVPLAPVLAMAVTTGLAVQRYQRGRSLADEGLHREALAVYQSALRIPSRDTRPATYLWLGLSHQSLGDLAEAERAFLMAEALEKHPGWPDILLARLHHRFPGTPYYDLDEAARWYDRVINAASPKRSFKEKIRAEMQEMRRKHPTQ